MAERRPAPVFQTRAVTHCSPFRIATDFVAAALLLAALAAVYAWDPGQADVTADAPGLEVALPEREDIESPPPPPPQLEPPPLPPQPEPPAPPVIEPPTPELPPVDPTPRIRVVFTRDGRFGVAASSGNPDDAADDGKRLTYSLDGETNNTRVWVDGATPLFGDESDGAFLRRADRVEPLRTEFEWEYDQVRVTQSVLEAAGDVSRRMDCVQVDYLLENTGDAPREVGLRVMIDSLIGDNDGVPFIVPGTQDLLDFPRGFRGDEVPDFVRALEQPDLAQPGVIVDLSLRPDEGERPAEVVLAHWPGTNATWEYDRTAAFDDDSAIGLYYPPRDLMPGERRHIRFRYGLGTISSQRSKNASLSLTAGGPFRAGGKFWLVALVQNPMQGQTVRLELPPQLELAMNETAEKSVPAGKDYTQISWLLQARDDACGSAEVQVQLSPEGIKESTTINIEPSNARLTLAASGPFTAGGAFWVSAVVQDGRAGQAVKLSLPNGLSFAKDHAARQTIPAGDEAAAARQFNWLVEITPQAVGKHVVTAELTGDDPNSAVQVTKEIDAAAPTPRLVLSPKGPFRRGRSCWVVALVQFPPANATVELTLPPGWKFAAKHSPSQRAMPHAGKSHAQINWLIEIPHDASGMHEFSARLLPGELDQKAQVEVSSGSLID